nr:hypothetical protein BaRGS_027935 [Batillaria attramentaria]
MSAIEMMDPKMDAGMLCNQIQRKVHNLEQAVEAGLVKIDNLSHEELIGIMDATLATLTIFTNLYLHNPYIINDRCLKAFCIVMLKTVDEDFQPMSYGFKMAGDVTETRASGMLKEVEDDLARTIRHQLAVALHTRVRFYRHFYALLLVFSKDRTEGLPQAQKLITQLQELVPLMHSSVALGIQPPGKEVSKNDYPTIMGFEPLINQRLLPPTFPRYTVIRDRADSMNYITTLLQRLLTVTMITELGSLHATMITGHNRARQRDKWAHMLDDLSNLQEEADKVDAYLHSLLIKTEPNRSHLACLGTWVLYHTLQTMINYILAGFELELYAPYEYHYVYWYLSELLFAWLVSTLHRADNFLLEHETLSDQQKGRSNKKNKKKKRPRSLSREITLAQAQQQMFAVVGLQMGGKMKQPDFEFDNEEVRFSHRFAPFASVVTPPMEMSDMSRYDREPAPEDLYGAACKGFHQAKCMLESLLVPTEEVQALLRVAKTNFVVMKLLMGGHKKDSKDAPEFDFSQHKVYPVIKVV